METGALSVISSGPDLMLEWFAESWDSTSLSIVSLTVHSL